MIDQNVLPHILYVSHRNAKGGSAPVYLVVMLEVFLIVAVVRQRLIPHLPLNNILRAAYTPLEAGTIHIYALMGLQLTCRL